MTKTRVLAGIGVIGLGLGGYASAAGFFTNGVPPAGGTANPTTIPLTGAETIPADTNLAGGAQPQSEAITTQQLAGFAVQTTNTAGFRNALIGGDFGTNLWQRGTTSASITTALLYGPDRWWGKSGTGTAFTISKQTGATDIFQGSIASARVQRTAAQTGVVPICFGQVLTTANSSRFQGQTAEFSFHALAGADFSAASLNVVATIGYSVAGAADQTAANFQTTAWTGQVNVNATLPISATWGRYSVVAPIPVTSTQLGVKICYTPVGTAGTNDWFEVLRAQLDVNPAAVGMSPNASPAVVGSAASFEYRPSVVETTLQQTYYYRITEGAAASVIATCQVYTTSLAGCIVPFPTTMRAVPVFTGDGSLAAGFAGTVASGASLVNCTALALSTTPASNAATTQAADISCASSAGFGAAGTVNQLFTNGGTGVIGASAEL